MTRPLTEIKARGIADEWGGDMDRAVVYAYRTGYQMTEHHRKPSRPRESLANGLLLC